MLSGAALGGLWWLTANSALAQATLRADRKPGNVFVSVFLRGGADSLNIVAPYGEDNYYRQRPSLALPNPKSKKGNRLIDIDGFFGLNQALWALEEDLKEGRLAAVHAVGSQDDSHSHFEAMATMERGWLQPGETTGGGWLARHLNATSGRTSPLRAVSITSTLPDSLLGATGAIAIESMENYRLEAKDEEFLEALRSLYANADDQMGIAGQDTLSVLDSLSKVDPNQYKPDGGATYPDTPLGKAFREVAFLIKQDLGLEVACLDAGGWDTHVTQGTADGWMYGLLDDLGQSMAAFRKDLGSLMDQTTILVQSEFGRRLKENSGLGTDHGSGGAMLALGAGVRGGKVYGDWPGLNQDQLTGPGDLRVTTDYRTVLAEILEQRLATPDIQKVFPGVSNQRIKMVSA